MARPRQRSPTSGNSSGRSAERARGGAGHCSCCRGSRHRPLSPGQGNQMAWAPEAG